MSLAGIDTSKYKSHSTRGASASYLASMHFDVKDIMNSTGLSKEETLKRFIILNRTILLIMEQLF